MILVSGRSLARTRATPLSVPPVPYPPARTRQRRRQSRRRDLRDGDSQRVRAVQSPLLPRIPSVDRHGSASMAAAAESRQGEKFVALCRVAAFRCGRRPRIRPPESLHSRVRTIGWRGSRTMAAPASRLIGFRSILLKKPEVAVHGKSALT